MAWLRSVLAFPVAAFYASVAAVVGWARRRRRVRSGKELLREWLTEELLIRFAGRILSIDAAVMLTWGQLTATLEPQGRKLPAMNSLIAALALQGGFTLVTRNAADFRDTGVTVLNPWL